MGGIKRQALGGEEKGRDAVALGALADRGMDVFCWCNRCGHHAVVPTIQLMRQLGAGCPVPEVGAAMRCTSCGSRDVATRPDWPSPGRISRHGASSEQAGP